MNPANQCAYLFRRPNLRRPIQLGLYDALDQFNCGRSEQTLYEVFGLQLPGGGRQPAEGWRRIQRRQRDSRLGTSRSSEGRAKALLISDQVFRSIGRTPREQAEVRHVIQGRRNASGCSDCIAKGPIGGVIRTGSRIAADTGQRIRTRGK